MKKLFLLFALIISTFTFAQPEDDNGGGVINPTRNLAGFTTQPSMNASAIFQVENINKGCKLSGGTQTQRDLITSPISGLIYYNTTTSAYNYWNGGAWAVFGGGGATPTLQEVTDTGSITTNPIESGNIIANDVIGGSPPFQGHYGTLEESDVLIAFIDDWNSGNNVQFKRDVSTELLRAFYLPNQSGNVQVFDIKTSSFTSFINCGYRTNGTITVTDPTPVTNKGYIVHVIGGTSTIGGVGYTTGALVYRYYNGTVWTSKDYGAGGGVATVTGTGVTGTPTDPIVNMPTATQVGALSLSGNNATGDVNIGNYLLESRGLRVKTESGSLYLYSNAEEKLFKAGDIDGFGDNTKMIIDDANQTINFTLNNANSFRVNDNQILTKASGLTIDGSNATGNVDIGLNNFHAQKLSTQYGNNVSTDDYSVFEITNSGLYFIGNSGSDYDNFGYTELNSSAENGFVAKYFNLDGSIYNIETSVGGNIQKIAHSTSTDDAIITHTVEGISGTSIIQQTPNGIFITAGNYKLNGVPVLTRATGLSINGDNATTDVNIGGNAFFATGIKSDGNNVLTEVSTTASLAPSTNRNYQTDAQQTNNDATSPIQGQIDGKQASLGFTPENVANKITGALTTSTTSYPASSLVKSVTDANAANIATNTSNIATNTSNIALKANIASPTFTGTVTIPNGAVLGTPTSVNLANATFPTLNQNTTGSAASLSADIPQSRVTNLVTALSGKQESLVSGTNIKTINGTTLLGSGDIVTTSTGVAGTLNVNTTAVGNIGTGEDDLITYSVSGGTLANNNDYLSFYNSGTFAGSINSKRLKLKFGSNTIFDSGTLSVTVSSDWSINGKIIRTSATTFKAVVSFTSSFGTLMGSADYVTGSETFSGNIILKATGEATANNDVLNELQLVCLNSQTTDALSSYMTKTANGSDISNIATFRANIGQDKITSIGNVNYTILPTDKVVATSATLTASITWTLPLANSVTGGYEINVTDLFGGVSSTNTLIIARAGSDTFNGATSNTIAARHGARRITSDGVSKWTFDSGVMRISDYIGTTLTPNGIVGTDSNSKLKPAIVDEDYLQQDMSLIAMQAMGSSIKGYNIGAPVPTALSANVTLSNQTLYFTTIYIPKTVTLTGCRWFQTANGVYTGNNYNGVGLYTISGGTLTLVASSTNDANCWAQGTGWQSKVFSSTYVATKGIYYVAHIYSQSAQTTAPSVAYNGSISATFSSTSSFDFTNNQKVSSSLTSQTSLPSTQATSGISSTAFKFGIYLY